MGLVLFRGLTPGSKLQEKVNKWWVWFEVFDAIRSAEGDYLHYPRSGGYYDQLRFEMEILAVIRNVYKDERKRESASGSKSPHYRPR